MPTEQDHPQNLHFRLMTVANIRDDPSADHVDVVFLESARFYRLDRSNPGFEQAIHLLRRAMEEGGVVNVGLESQHSDLICDIHER